jgi:diguanylate cyclase (GGDEF)-like protein
MAGGFPEQESSVTRDARTSASNQSSAADPSGILASIGLVPYDWRIDTDTLSWGANAAEVLQVGDLTQIATGRGYAGYLDPNNTSTRYDAVMQTGGQDAGGGVPYQTEYCLKTGRDGATKLWVEDNGRWFAGPDGRPARAHGVVRAITERHDNEQRLAYLSRFDGLTGEMNRNALTEALQVSLDEAVKYRGSCGFMLIAVDNLARINESYGFGIADEVIASVGRRLRSRMRGADKLGRFSSNKFGVVLNTCTPGDLKLAADRFLAAVREDVVQTANGPVAATITVGGVAAPRHARTVPEIIAHAQESLDAAKAKRRGSFVAYRPNVERDAARKENARATDKIVTALNERRILIAFEPVVSTTTREPAFYECLMRIRRADGSIVPASAVIPIAEQLGLVRLIDHRVLELVTAELAAVPSLKASVNVSPDSITDPDWWSALGAQLRARPGVAQRMILEITETAAIQNIDETAGFVTRAKDLGCRIAIDDFGAGYTSFRNLRRLGVDMIKIDGAFVQNLPRSPDDRAFVRTLVDLGRSLGLQTVAEWVQGEDAAVVLTDWGCDFLQGDLIGRASLEKPWEKAAQSLASAAR